MLSKARRSLIARTDPSEPHPRTTSLFIKTPSSEMAILSGFRPTAVTLPLFRRPLNPPIPVPLPLSRRRPFLPPPARPFRRLNAETSATIAIGGDDKYGKKQVVSVTPQLYDYILSNVREPQILRELREETGTMRGSQMQVSPDQAQLLAMLVQILGAQRCIEVGIYTGYSSLAIALALPESGRLVACERDGNCLETAKKYYERAGVSHKVDIKHTLAADALKSLILNGEACSYDFAFVDADKRMYAEYFELLFQLVRIGGLIVFDNVLWHGRVADPRVNDPRTVSIRNFNKKLLEDKRISISMVPIGDGMTICCKREDA